MQVVCRNLLLSGAIEVRSQNSFAHILCQGIDLSQKSIYSVTSKSIKDWTKYRANDRAHTPLPHWHSPFFHLLKEHDMTCMPCNYVVLMASNFSSIDLINYWVREFQRESPCTKHQSSIHMTDSINYLSISYLFFPHSIRIK